MDAGNDTLWGSYLDSFHDDHAGITEVILERCVDDAGITPYQWIADAIGPGRTVLDLACGSGPIGAGSDAPLIPVSRPGEINGLQ